MRSLLREGTRSMGPPTPTRLVKVYKGVLVVPLSSPHQRTFVCGAYIDTAQVRISLVSLLDPLFKWSRFHCLDIYLTGYLVTNKNMMTISGTHIQRLHSSQVRHHTKFDLLTFFVKHMMINPQVRHHFHLDLTTCRVCSVTCMMIMRQYLHQLWYHPYPLHACGRGLCLWYVRWSEIWYQDGCLMTFAKGVLSEEYLSHNFW